MLGWLDWWDEFNAGLQSAEDYHQQYLYKVPGGYCPDHSTGVSCPIGLKLD
jgi:peptide methionine sulfoxide reductase MsrA